MKNFDLFSPLPTTHPIPGDSEDMRPKLTGGVTGTLQNDGDEKNDYFEEGKQDHAFGMWDALGAIVFVIVGSWLVSKYKEWLRKLLRG